MEGSRHPQTAAVFDGTFSVISFLTIVKSQKICSKFRSYLSIYFFVKILNMNKNMNPVHIFLCKNIHPQILLAWTHKTGSTNKKNQRTVPKRVTAWCCAINGRWTTRSKTFLKARLRMCSCWALMLTIRQLKHWVYFDIISVRLETPIILFTGIKLQLDQYFRIQIFAIVLLLLSHMMTPLNLVLTINLCPGQFQGDDFILEMPWTQLFRKEIIPDNYQWPGTFCSPGHITATGH